MRSLLKVLGQSKRLTSVAAFGASGMLLTATWAAGVATTPGANNTNTSSAPLVAGAPSSNTDRFDGQVTLGPDGDTGLIVNFSGRWGILPNADDAGVGTDTTDYQMFELDLLDAALDDEGTYFVEVGMLATPAPANFTAVQVEWLIDDEDCDTANFTPSPAYQAAVGTVDSAVLFGDNLDNSVVFPELTNSQHGSVPLSDVYCVGVAATGAAIASDTAGSFIRRADAGLGVTLPTFVAILNEHT